MSQENKKARFAKAASFFTKKEKEKEKIKTQKIDPIPTR